MHDVSVGSAGATVSARRLDVKLYKQQLDVVRKIVNDDCAQNRVCIAWGRAGGKSYILREVAWLLVSKWDGKFRPKADKPGVRIVLLMPTLAQYKRVHGKNLDFENEGKWSFLGGRFNHTDFVISFPGGSWIRVVSAEQRNTLAGIRCDVVLCDECDDLPIGVVDALVAPWIAEEHSLKVMVFSGTPRKGRDGLLYREYRAGLDKKPNQYTFHATSYDFPHVSKSWVDGQKRIVSDALFRREYLCDFDSAEGLVYSMFKEGIHIRMPDERTRWTEFLVGVDHGWEDPGVMLLIGVAGSGADAVLHVIGESHASHKGGDYWDAEAKTILEQVGTTRTRWYCDPSRPDLIDRLKRVGIICGDVDNSIEAGVETVSNLLTIRETADKVKRARLYIAPFCVNTIRELGSYRRKRDRADQDKIKEEIAPGFDHCMDALRYACHSRFGRPQSSRSDDGSFHFG